MRVSFTLYTFCFDTSICVKSYVSSLYIYPLEDSLIKSALIIWLGIFKIKSLKLSLFVYLFSKYYKYLLQAMIFEENHKILTILFYYNNYKVWAE